jgi:membrane protease subunit HflK
MVDVDGGNNMMYLPLDKMMQQHQNTQRVAPQPQSQTQQSSNNSSPSSAGRSDRFDSGSN